MREPLYYIQNKITSMRDLHVLQQLAFHKRVNISALSNALVSTASVTTIITKLAKQGLVKRVSSQGGDRRNVFVEITQAGEDLVNG